MLNFVLGIVLAAMLVRGWTRGFVRESLDLIGLVVGILIAFRMSAPVGDFLTDSFGVGPEVARIGAGIALFVLFGVTLSIAAHYLSKMMNLPGLSMVNRIGGAAVAVGWGIAVVFVVLTLVTVFPVPQTWRGQIDESAVAQSIVGDGALPRQVFEEIAGDNLLAVVGALRDLFGATRVVPVGDEMVEIPAAQPDELRQVRSEAEALVGRLNEYRVGIGLSAVQPVASLTELAEDHAVERYTKGIVSRITDCQQSLAARSHQVLACDNAVALAGTAIAGFDGILDTDQGGAMYGDPAFDRVGIAVVQGPTGRMVVMVLAG